LKNVTKITDKRKIHTIKTGDTTDDAANPGQRKVSTVGVGGGGKGGRGVGLRGKGEVGSNSYD